MRHTARVYHKQALSATRRARYNARVKISEIGEFSLIDLLQREFAASSPDIVVDNGDDTAAWRSFGVTLATTDTVVEDVHFRLGTITWEELGWKSLAVNLSDIASMGGQPRYALLTLGLSASIEVEDVVRLARGLAEAGREFNTIIIGGDMVASPRALFVTVALYGVVPEDGMGPPLTRSSARPGDLVAVTGELGKSAAGFRLLNGEREAPPQVLAELRRAHNKPWPRVREGHALRATGVRTAMDISDGLAGDLGHIARLSNVGIRLTAENLPVHSFVREVFGEEGFDLALFGGEEYELVFTAPPEMMELAQAALGRLGTKSTVIGEVVAEHAGQVTMTRANEGEVVLTRGGFDHFRG